MIAAYTVVNVASRSVSPRSVRAHFHALLEIIAAEKGAVVKTIGDAVMDKLNAERGRSDLIVKIGIHEGPCLAVMLNERQDYSRIPSPLDGSHVRGVTARRPSRIEC